jgi:toxin ParE1/3/4
VTEGGCSFTPSGRLQFLSAVETIRRTNPSAARQFQLQAAKALKRLRRFPESGAVISEYPELPYREVSMKPYRFFYRVQEDKVWIVAVWHGARIPDDSEGGSIRKQAGLE